MKKLIVTILSAVCLGACSSDTEVQDINGVYKYDTSDYSIYVRVRDSKASAITVEAGKRSFVWDAVQTSGSYPDYKYRVGTFAASFHYADASASAILDGVLKPEDEGVNLSGCWFSFDNVAAIFYKE